MIRSPRPGLAPALRTATRDLHRRAEGAGIVRAIIAGQVSRAGYALYLRNLWPAYRALEQGLEAHRHTPGVGRLALPQLYRADPIARDLAQLAGPDWAADLPLLPAGARYAAAVEAAAAGDGAGLVGHAYTRYLGDLSGGRVLARILARMTWIMPGGLAFHAFPDIPDVEAFKAAYRAALDAIGLEIADPERAVAAACAAFDLNIQVAEAAQAAAS